MTPIRECYIVECDHCGAELEDTNGDTEFDDYLDAKVRLDNEGWDDGVDGTYCPDCKNIPWEDDDE